MVSTPMNDDMNGLSIQDLAARLGRALTLRDWRMATAESCTGGLIAGALTDVPGSSEWFLGGVVAYANSAKESLLGVSHTDLTTHGAVSRAVVQAMARGARTALGADLAVAVSGVAGPSGGTPDKPVGTVWIAWSWAESSLAERFQFSGDRAAVREATVRTALICLLRTAESR